MLALSSHPNGGISFKVLFVAASRTAATTSLDKYQKSQWLYATPFGDAPRGGVRGVRLACKVVATHVGYGVMDASEVLEHPSGSEIQASSLAATETT